MLAEYLRLIVLSAHNRYYGPEAVFNTGPCQLGKAFANVYDKHDDDTKMMMRKFPIQAGTYRWNKYYIGSSLLPVNHDNSVDHSVIQHKFDGCNGETSEKDWLGKGNDHRVLHERRLYYCEANHKIL